MPRPLIRFLLILLGGVVATGIAALHFWLIYTYRGPFKRDSFGMMFLEFAPCSTFMATYYHWMRIGYKVTGLSDEIEHMNDLRQSIRWINVLVIVILIASFFIK